MREQLGEPALARGGGGSFGFSRGELFLGGADLGALRDKVGGAPISAARAELTASRATARSATAGFQRMPAAQMRVSQVCRVVGPVI
ncbi:MAG TPA: hypothetical protein VFC52_04810 [Solirubrobacterales bacterium]|nr:hypothetical protein [Solirubrobacterales bacterium]